MSTILKNAKDRDDLPLPVRPQIPTCKRQQDVVTYKGKLKIRLAVLWGKLDWIVLLVSGKVLPNGQWQTPGKKTKEHGKHTPPFCLSAL